MIRPGIYCRERQLRDFSYAAGLPVINENCPACFEAPKERHHIKKLLAREEGVFPSLYPCLRRALTPLLDPAATDLLAAIRRAVERQSKVGRQALARSARGAREEGGRPESGRGRSTNRSRTGRASTAAATTPTIPRNGRARRRRRRCGTARRPSSLLSSWRGARGADSGRRTRVF